MYRKIHQLSRKFEEYATLILSFLINSVRYRRKRLDASDIRRIVVIKLDHIGDVILSIPAIANLKANFPRARIDMVVNSSSRTVAGYIPYVDGIFCYDARFFDRSGNTKMLDLARGIHFAREMRRRDFDLIVDLRSSFASLLFALIAKSRYRIDRGTYLIHRKSGKASLASEHEAEVNLDILTRAGLSARSRELFLALDEADLDSADLLLDVGKPFAAIHPGSPAELKRWPVEMFATLGCQLLREYGFRIVLIGGKGEEHLASSVASAIDGQVTDLSGKTTLGQLAAVLRKADIFIGNDSGPMHLAAASGTKVIGLFGPTSPQRFGPYGERCTGLRMEQDCPPCMRNECRRLNYRCIDQITVNDVMNIVRRMMAQD